MANRFLNNITINDAYTLPSTDGTAGQAIITDGSGNLSFGSAIASSATSAEATHLQVKNTSGSLISKGTPVYITGNVGNTDKLEIAPADASDSAKMPAIGLLESDLSNNGEGYVAQGGYLKGLATATIDGSSSTSNDTIYVKSGGGLTLTKPTGSTVFIQNIAKVARVHSSNGSVIVSSILRANDVPNLSTGKIWVGTATNTAESSVIDIDETNNILTVDGKVYFKNVFSTLSDLPSATTYHGMFAHVHAEGAAYYAHSGSWVKLANHSDLAGSANDATITLTAGTGLSGGGDFTTDQATNETITVDLADTAVTPGTYGDANNTPQITIDQQGRITSATTVTTAGSGGGGGGGAELTIERDVFTATANQTAFVISSDITASSNTQVYIDGVYQAKDNYTTSGSTVTFSTGVPLGAEVEVVHFISVLSKVYTDTFTGDGSDVTFDASKDVTDENVTQVYIDGVYQSKDNYTTSGTTITFSTAPPNGSAIEVVHFTAAEYSALNSNQFTGTGSQTDFTLTQAVDIDKSFVFIQGIYQEKSTYSITGTTLTFTTAPQSGYTVEVITVGAVSIFNDTLFLDSFTGNNSTTDYTLSTTPASENAIDVYLNGIYQNKSTFSLSGSTLTFSSAPTTGTAIEVKSTGGLNNVVSSGAGGIDWQTTPKTSAFTAVAGKGYFVNTTSAAITVTLPSSPSAGDELTIVDYAGTADTNNITITSSDNINGSSNDVKIDYERGGVSMVYVDATQGWIAYNAANETATSLPVDIPLLTVDYLVIAGGGAGGRATGGGGGAGGYRNSYNNETSGGGASSETSLTLNVSTNYTVTVGAGAANGTGSGTGSNGSNSSFGIVGSEITSTGGGGGAGGNTTGISGGSGGGGNSGNSGGSGTANQGFNGGGSVGGTGGGGGGAGSLGETTSGDGGDGGDGLSSLITGSPVTRAGGGGGMDNSGTLIDGVGGSGGGGDANQGGNAGSGTINTGSGGGGTRGIYYSGAGGSGVVILRYPDSYNITVGSGLTTGQLNTSVGTNEKYTTFTAGTGTISFS